MNDLSHSVGSHGSACVDEGEGQLEKGMRTGELAGEGLLSRVGSEVRDKCEARSLWEATTGARGPFTGVVGFVHAYVICGGHKNVRALRRDHEGLAKRRAWGWGGQSSAPHLHVGGV